MEHTTPPLDAGPHILIIDERPDDLRLLVQTLRGRGLQINMAFDGKQGYDRALALMPDIILLEVVLPKMDGFTVARMLKANPVTAHIPILFLTATTGLAERLTGLREGGADYINKPFSVEEVVERVSIHLRLAGPVTKTPHGYDLLAGSIVVSESSEYSVLVRAAKAFLLKQFGAVSRLNDLAQALGVSERRLANAFQHRLGITVFEFMRQERMQKARRLLTQTSLSVGAIAEELGFSSAANFSTAFREYVGASPSVFRSRAFSANEHFGTDLSNS